MKLSLRSVRVHRLLLDIEPGRIGEQAMTDWEKRAPVIREKAGYATGMTSHW